MKFSALSLMMISLRVSQLRDTRGRGGGNLSLLVSESETPLDAQCQKSIPDYIATSESRKMTALFKAAIFG